MDESFWASRFQQKYGVLLWKYGVSHKDIYKEFSNLKGEELVKRAIDYDFIELVERLLPDNNEDDLLVYASKTGHLNIVKLLLNKGAYVHVYDDYSLVLAAQNGYIEVVDLLLNRGAGIKNNINEALECAASTGKLEVVKLLLDRGADIHTEDDSHY